jgi:hypothetical protein
MKSVSVRALSSFLLLAPACGSSGTSGKAPSPPNLRQFESDAEAMSENASPAQLSASTPAAAPDWTVAQGSYDQAAALWQQLKPVVLAAGPNADAMAQVTAIDQALAAYATDVAAKKPREAATDANKITLAVPTLFDLFSYPAPTDTLRLDGTFRQLQIEAQFGDWPASQKALDDTKAVWARLKPLAGAQAPKRPDMPAAATLLTDVDDTIAASQALITDAGAKASDSVDLQLQAQEGLDLVDVAEQIFK